MTEYIHAVLGGIDPELVELADRPPKKRVSRRVRGALVAACLCVTLVAAACAAALSGVFVGEPGSFEVGDMTLDGVRLVVGGAELFPWDDFDPEFRERAREQMEESRRRGETAPITYYGWARASEQMGFPLADSSYLAGCVDINCSVWVFDSQVRVMSMRRVDGVNVDLYAVISLENSMSTKLENVIAPQGDDSTAGTEACTMPDGSSAVIYSYRNNGKVYYTACFVLDGVVYMVNVEETAEYDESRAALLRSILSGFES